MQGFNWSHGRQLLTIFSAPNYCYRCGNQAALLRVGEHMEQSLCVRRRNCWCSA